MTYTFKEATRENLWGRLAIYGPSGAGKTYTGLRIGTGMLRKGEKMAVVCTEHRSARKYSHKFKFNVIDLDEPTIAHYCQCIDAAVAGGFKVLLIDSLSHAWRELCAEIGKLARTKYHGNTHSAWSEGTPQQKILIEKILKAPIHIICTMRSRTEWLVDKDERGKNKITRLGTQPEQGKGIEYEFDALLEMTENHYGRFVKDRSTGFFQDKIFEKPDEAVGHLFLQWLESGEATVSKTPILPGLSWRNFTVQVGSETVKNRKLGEIPLEMRTFMASKLEVKPTSSRHVIELREALDSMLLEIGDVRAA